MRNFCAARPHFPQKWGENHNFSCQILSIQKNHLLRPRFLKSPGSEDTIFPYRYFWHTNLQFFARISWKMGSVHKFFLHRPPGGPFPNRRPVRWEFTFLWNSHSIGSMLKMLIRLIREYSQIQPKKGQSFFLWDWPHHNIGILSRTPALTWTSVNAWDSHPDGEELKNSCWFMIRRGQAF